jgi:hypothetical protein
MTPTYCYIIEHHEDGVRSYLTNWERPIKLKNLPARFAADAEQAFQRMPIAHSANNMSADFSQKTIDLMISTQDDRMRRYFATAPAVKVSIYIIRVNTEMLLEQDAVIDYAKQCLMVNSGVVGNITIQGQQIQATITPEPHLTNVGVPRYFFERTCNHVLYGSSCKANADTFKLTGTITATDRPNRSITVSVQGPNADYLRNGYLLHVQTGLRIGINSATHVGTTSVLALRFWTPEFAIGNDVICFAGCRHTTDDCRSKFGNIANFGGFPYVPNKNPTLNGVVT